ncbi:MAG: hypothetical protein WC797_03240 [Candidatus Paceibacterota bacterium]|jgi:hypothetical protein
MDFESLVNRKKPLPQYTKEKLDAGMADEDAKRLKADGMVRVNVLGQEPTMEDNAVPVGEELKYLKVNPAGLFRVLDRMYPGFGTVPRFDTKTGGSLSVADSISQWRDKVVRNIPENDPNRAGKIAAIDHKFAVIRKDLDL